MGIVYLISMVSIGIYPGTFDPIHEGHLAFALAAVDGHGLSKVFFLPERNPRNKLGVTEIADRYKQINDAIAGYTSLGSLTLDQDQFTTDSTLPTLLGRFEGHQLYLLVGSDVALRLAQWQSIDKLLHHMKIIVGIRSRDKLDRVAIAIEPLGAHVSYLSTDKAHLSSSMYRQNKPSQ